MNKLLLLGFLCLPVFAADELTTFFDNQLKSAENDVVALAAAMPADKYDFAPTQGTFTGVRTFATQVKHIATVMYMLSAANLGVKPPVDIGTGDNGPDNLKTKDQILGYLKGAFELTHKSIATIDSKNQLEKVKGPFGRDMMRVQAASMPAWHSFDHYGQMVVYARMNGVVPHAPAAAKK